MTAAHVVPREHVGRDAWDAFVDRSDEAWLWHRYDALAAMATWHGKRDASFALLADSGDLLAVMPLHFIALKRGPLPAFTLVDSFGGPALANDLPDRVRSRALATIVEHVRAVAATRRTLEINVALTALAPAFRGERCPRTNPLLALGMENTLTQTWIVDLRAGAESAWRGMAGRARTTIRKAEKAGVRVRPAGPGDVDAYYELHAATYRRTGVEPHPKAYFEAIWERFLPSGLSRVLVGEVDGEVVAARNFGIYKSAGVSWTAASDERALRNGANSLLQWKAMEWMASAGIDWSETGEAFPELRGGKLKGLTEFKASFGGELYPIYRGRLGAADSVVSRLYRARRLLRGGGAAEIAA